MNSKITVKQGPHRQIWAIAGPAILANSSAPLVGLVDTWAIGHLPGAVHLAAVGLGSVIFNYILWAFGFLRMGTTGLIAQAFGRDDMDEMVVTVVRSSALALLFGLLLFALQEAVQSPGKAQVEFAAARNIRDPDTGLLRNIFNG